MNTGTDILTVNKSTGFLTGKMIFSIASFVFGMVLFFIFIIPQYREMKILAMEEDLRSANLDKKNQTLSKMKVFERKMDDISDSEIEKIKMLIPSDDKIEFQLSNLDIFGRVMKVELHDLKVSKKEGGNDKGSGEKNNAEKSIKLQSGNLQSVTYDFKIKGSYSDIVMFIRSIERNIPMFQVSKISLEQEKPKSSKEDAPQITTNKVLVANISMSSYNY